MRALGAADARRLHELGFYHRQKHQVTGHFITEEIARKNVSTLADVVPSLRSSSAAVAEAVAAA